MKLVVGGVEARKARTATKTERRKMRQMRPVQGLTKKEEETGARLATRRDRGIVEAHKTQVQQEREKVERLRQDMEALAGRCPYCVFRTVGRSGICSMDLYLHSEISCLIRSNRMVGGHHNCLNKSHGVAV